MPRTLLIATSNPGKIDELGEMLRHVPVQLAGLHDLTNVVEVPETGSSFAENARLKATGYAEQAGLHALADDSGLEVAALAGRPGIHSARYGGDDLSFADKIQKLLREVSETGSTDRRARFVCAIAFADPYGCVLGVSEGVCTGTLATGPRGDGGFGYDPIFIPDGQNETFAELPAHIKAQISHRARAFSQIMPILRQFYGLSA